MLILASGIAVFALLAVYDLFFLGIGSSAGGSTAARPASSSAAASASERPQAAPVKRPASAAVRALSIAAVTAFGPEGTADGDNADTVSRALYGGSGTKPWRSSWYATADFGNLQPGTGLLLDMGKTVQVSSVQVVLGAELGADLQVRVGRTAALADLTTAASASDVGSLVKLHSARAVSGRYVLIWFTRLPLSSRGKYEVSVYSVGVKGTARS